MKITPQAVAYTVKYMQDNDIYQDSIRMSILHAMNMAPYVQQAMKEQERRITGKGKRIDIRI